MKHNMSFYKEDFMERPNQSVITFLGAIAAFAGFLGCLPPYSGLWALVILLTGIFVILSNVALHHTHVNRSLKTENKREAWAIYNQLPKAEQRSIPLTAKSLAKMNKSAAYDIRYDLQQVLNNHNENQKILDETSGATFAIRQAVAEAKRNSANELSTTREVYEDLKNKELI